MSTVPQFPSGIVEWAKRKRVWKYIASPHMRKARCSREREKWGTTDKAHAFDSSRPTDQFWSVEFLSSFKSIKCIQWHSFSHWAVISGWCIFDSCWQIAMEEPIRVMHCESNAKSKAKSLSVVPHFSAVSRFSHVGWYNVFSRVTLTVLSPRENEGLLEV